MGIQHLELLKDIVDTNPQAHIYSCINDLVVNGIDKDHFQPDELMPDRQKITRFLAAWFLHGGLDQDLCLNWLINYAQNVLKIISSSSLSQVKHSTKSNIKYIYRDRIKFICHGPYNVFKAECEHNCPLYYEQLRLYEIYQKKQETFRMNKYVVPKKTAGLLSIPPQPTTKEINKIIEEKADEGLTLNQIADHLNGKEILPPYGHCWTKTRVKKIIKKYQLKIPIKILQDFGYYFNPKKEIFKEQFEKAVDIIREKIKKDETPESILDYLKKNSFKTRTGKEWSGEILYIEIKKLK